MQRPAGLLTRSAFANFILLLTPLVMTSACHEATGLTSPNPAIVGTVRNVTTNTPVVGAQVIAGTSVDTTDATGRFALVHLDPGAAKLQVNAAGFDSLTMDVTVTNGEVVQNVQLKRKTLFNVGDFSAYIPDTVDRVDAVLVALGGPDTRGFSAGTPFGAPLPDVETALQNFGQQLRVMARTRNFAIIGTSKAAMASGAESDALIADALSAAATISGHPEIARAPILMYGLSGGGPEASGYAARNPQRMVGLFLKSPLKVELLTTASQRSIPTFVVLAEFDAFIDNSAIKAAFQANRKDGALWGLAMEAGVPHHFLTPAQQQLTSNWMSTTLSSRVKPDGSGLTSYPETQGWLGNHQTGEIATWSAYTGDKTAASWFASNAVAENWRGFRKPGQ